MLTNVKNFIPLDRCNFKFVLTKKIPDNNYVNQDDFRNAPSVAAIAIVTEGDRKGAIFFSPATLPSGDDRQ
ncbi:MAG: hypothetical protein U7127_21245 [Phormidium sp.]